MSKKAKKKATAASEPSPAPVEATSVEAPSVQAAVTVEKAEPAVEEKAAKAKKAAAKPADEKQTDKPDKRKAGRPAKIAEDKAAQTARKAKGEDAATAIYVQYQGGEESVAELTERVKSAFKAEHKRTAIEQINIYIKPEERAAYYVVNERFSGKVDY